MHSTSQSSVLSYSVTRPFPFPWLTWVVVVGGTILTVLFSFVAVASNAYELESIYTTNPNGTETKHEWYEQKPFSWFNSLDTRCQPSLLSVGGLYKTANRGFVYTLSGIEAIAKDPVGSSILPSIAYKNSTLEECEILNIHITLSRIDPSRLPMNYWTWGATTAAATIRCSLDSAAGRLQVNLTATLPPAGGNGVGSLTAAGSAGAGTTTDLIDNFKYQKQSGDINMFYGMQLTVWWYGKLSTAMGYTTPPSDTEDWGTGNIGLTRNNKTSDYTQPSFFHFGAAFTTDQRGLYWAGDTATLEDWITNSTRDGTLNGMPNIAMTVDAFGKSWYSLLLFDLGVRDPAFNALASETGIRYLQSRNDTQLANISSILDIPASGTVDQVLPIGQTLPASNTNRATTIFTQYLCSVPRRKGGVGLVFPVLIADIVFLQACWKAFCLITTWLLGRNDKEMNYCAGCIEAKRGSALLDDDSSVHPTARPTTLRSTSEGSELQTLIPMHSQRRPTYSRLVS